MQTVSVIVPTQVLPQRAKLIRRALRSILDQEGVRAIPLVIINGPAADPALGAELRADRRVRTEILDRADLPAAIRAGRGLVDTPWFAELDDDDLLLPGTLAARVRTLEEQPECQVVIANGIVRRSTGDTLRFTDASAVQRDPLGALVRRNWLSPGSWLGRTDAIGPSLFDRMPPALECTYLAISFALHHRPCFLDQPGVIWHKETPRSLSKSRDWAVAQVPALRRILEFDLPPSIARIYRRRIPSAQHFVADWYWRDGRVSDAWRWHLASLRESGGWRYLPFTRRLISALWAPPRPVEEKVS